MSPFPGFPPHFLSPFICVRLFLFFLHPDLIPVFRQMQQRLNTWAAVMWGESLQIWELHNNADVLCVLSVRPPGCRVMADLLPHTVREPVIRVASSQQGRPHLTSHEGRKRRTAGGKMKTEEPPEHLCKESWQPPAFPNKLQKKKKKKD